MDRRIVRRELSVCANRPRIISPTSVSTSIACLLRSSKRTFNLATTFVENFCPRRSPAVLSYYVFSASIMHVTSCTRCFFMFTVHRLTNWMDCSAVMDNPADVQAKIGLHKAMAVLKSISVRRM